MRLPIAAAAAKRIGSPASDRQSRQPLQRRVLVVDDNRDAAASLAMLLRFLGSDVRIANDGASALSLIKDFQPEVVLVDIGMPGMDGFEVARQIRKNASTIGSCWSPSPVGVSRKIGTEPEMPGSITIW